MSFFLFFDLQTTCFSINVNKLKIIIFIQMVFKILFNVIQQKYALQLKKLYMESISIWNNNNKQKIVTYLKLTRCQFGDQMFSCLMLYIQGYPDGLALIPRQLLCTHFVTIKMLDTKNKAILIVLDQEYQYQSPCRTVSPSFKIEVRMNISIRSFFLICVFFPSFLLSMQYYCLYLASFY